LLDWDRTLAQYARALNQRDTVAIGGTREMSRIEFPAIVERAG
jgi:hypothetical protein